MKAEASYKAALYFLSLSCIRYNGMFVSYVKDKIMQGIIPPPALPLRPLAAYPEKWRSAGTGARAILGRVRGRDS